MREISLNQGKSRSALWVEYNMVPYGLATPIEGQEVMSLLKTWAVTAQKHAKLPLSAMASESWDSGWGGGGPLRTLDQNTKTRIVV